MQALPVGAAKHRLQLFPKVLGVSGRQVGVESLAGLPDFKDREVIRVPLLPEYFETDDARILAAVGFKFAD